jgi:transcriptional regulator with XRE-family HTH domain
MVLHIVVNDPDEPPRWVIDVAERLREYRKQWNHTQASMAQYCNMDRNTYGRLERPSIKHRPTLDNLMQITRYTSIQFRLLITDGIGSLVPELS